MVAVKISAFGGMIPAQDDRLLPQNNSASNENCFLDGGSLQGMRIPRVLHTLVNPTYKYAYRIPLISADRNHITASLWLEFPDPDTNVLQSPVADDQWQRFYFASASGIPQYNTKARILAGSAPFTLGIPTPETAPTVVVTGGSGPVVGRAYVTTWVSAYGEEGPPSPPQLLSGNSDGTWTLTIPAPLTADTTDRNLAKTRCYRTVTSVGGSTTFFLVAEITIATLTYADTQTDVAVSSNLILETTDFGGPPSDLQGIVSMPNGMMVGWRSNEIWFSQQYMPHAWPAAYTNSVDANIVGLGVVGQTLVVLTDGCPWAMSGISPATMAISKIATLEPCMSRGSIVSTAQGVFYASPNGIVLAAYGIVQNASLSIATKDRWLELVNPEELRASRIGVSYYAWGNSTGGAFEPTAFYSGFVEQLIVELYGIIVNLADPRIAWGDLRNSVPTDNVLTDIWSGEIFLIRNGQVVWQDQSSTAIQGPYIWRSKQFQLTKANNIAVMRVWFEELVNDPTFMQNPTRNVSSPQTLAIDQYGLVRVFIDGTLIMTRELRISGEMMRLPSGFKNVLIQFEIEARVKVFNIETASSVKELSAV
jgi:hypothetical protein